MTVHIAGPGREMPYMPEYSRRWQLGAPVVERRPATRDDAVRRDVAAAVNPRMLAAFRDQADAVAYVANVEREARARRPVTAADRATALTRYGSNTARPAADRPLTAAERAARLRRYGAGARTRQAPGPAVPGALESYDTQGRYRCSHCDHPPARYLRDADGGSSVVIDHGPACPTRRTYGRS
ncbi:hypothetical protein LO772_19375 [Yinghuangia sp. ASG 101]|uniref:hypothetical protein n=1 Tax=Yinghuangia sp. ASG 101 TaxID=2896848 RepID=UPI001E3A23C8|nr:hypothetical protein [Yinghuangia sp. ASG 101]UGQ09119.1 hypothetical protein LO772_19375 [Yinghuangia sp. ASG 101]